MTKRRVRKGTYYFPSYEAAQTYAVMNNWPVDRIISYQLGWAIQLYCSGPYVGPASEGERRHIKLVAEKTTRNDPLPSHEMAAMCAVLETTT